MRAYPECSILAGDRAWALCQDCGHDFLVAFPCESRAFCPCCNDRGMAEAAVHLVDHNLLPLIARQRFLLIPKRQVHYLQQDRKAFNTTLSILLAEFERHLPANGTGAGLKACAEDTR